MNNAIVSLKYLHYASRDDASPSNLRTFQQDNAPKKPINDLMARH